MSELVATSIRETLLRQCLAADPAPWYPKEYAEKAGLVRESLYSPLNDLRIANLVQLTEWVRGKGQGYTITPLGKEVLDDPLFLAQLREGKAAAKPAPVAEANSAATRFDRGELARQAFFESTRLRVVPALMLINIVMFAASIVVSYRTGVGAWRFLSTGDPIALHKIGAVNADDLARGEWWRLVTNCFLHFGLLHLTLNMFSLSLLSRVESLWGSGRFLILYITCGICGSCAGVYYFPGDESHLVYLAGASGALWGVMISQIVWLLLHRSHLPPDDVRRWMWQIFYTLGLNVCVSMLPNVSAAAHIGGGIAGAIASLLLQTHRFGPPAKRALAGLLLALLPTAFLIGLAAAMEYDPRLQPFMAKVNREQIDARLGKLVAALDELEPKSEKLHLQPSDKRDAAELSRVRDGLSGLVKQAKEAREWLDKWTPVSSATIFKDRGLALIDALIPYAEALDTQAGGTVVGNINELRKNWQDAKLAWTQAMTRN
jgi:rhomboid protease GluP